MTNQKNNLKNLPQICFPGFFFAFTLFIFAPTEFYLTHKADFWFSFDQLLPVLILASVVCCILITVILSVLPKKAKTYAEILLYALTLLMYIQGNYMVKDYGTLNGAEIDWSLYRNQILINSCIWILLIIAVIVLMIKYGTNIRKYLRIAAVIVLCVQVVSLAAVFLTSRENQAQTDRYLSKKNEFMVSSGNNTIVLLLDAFDSQLMMDLHEKHTDYVEKVFENFTFYHNTVGGATRTKYAIPFIFSGKTNTEEISYPEYVHKASSESPFFKELHSGSYDAAVFTDKTKFDITQDDVIGNIYTGKAEVSSKFGLMKDYMKLIAFRYVPDAFARFFWLYSGDFDRWKAGGSTGEYAMGDVGFYRELVSNGLHTGTDKSTFRFYHLNGAHEPYSMNENSERVSYNDGSEEQQALGCFNIINTYFRQLKDLDAYDQANIIVMADHGFSIYSKVEQNPLFLVKISNEQHPFAISEIPLSYTMMPDLFAKAIKGELDNMEVFQTEGDRYFYLESENQSVINITEHVIHGAAYDNNAIEKTGTVYHGNTLNLSRLYKFGDEISFAEGETARNYTVSGFSRNEGTHTWTNGTSAEMQLEFTDKPKKDLQLTINIKWAYNEAQKVLVYANDVFLEEFTAHNYEVQQVRIPKTVFKSDDGDSEKLLTLRFEMPDACSPQSLGISSDGRILGLALISMVIKPVK